MAQLNSKVNSFDHEVVRAADAATSVVSLPGPPTIENSTGKPSTA